MKKEVLKIFKTSHPHGVRYHYDLFLSTDMSFIHEKMVHSYLLEVEAIRSPELLQTKYRISFSSGLMPKILCSLLEYYTLEIANCPYDEQRRRYDTYGPFYDNLRYGLHKNLSDFLVLNVVPGSRPSRIKKAYRNLANKYHPDKGGSEEQMKKINIAYQNLKKAGLL